MEPIMILNSQMIWDLMIIFNYPPDCYIDFAYQSKTYIISNHFNDLSVYIYSSRSEVQIAHQSR